MLLYFWSIVLVIKLVVFSTIFNIFIVVLLLLEDFWPNLRDPEFQHEIKANNQNNGDQSDVNNYNNDHYNGVTNNDVINSVNINYNNYYNIYIYNYNFYAQKTLQ